MLAVTGSTKLNRGGQNAPSPFTICMYNSNGDQIFLDQSLSSLKDGLCSRLLLNFDTVEDGCVLMDH